MTEHVRNLRFYLDMDIKFLTHHKGPVSIEAATMAEHYQLSEMSMLGFAQKCFKICWYQFQRYMYVNGHPLEFS